MCILCCLYSLVNPVLPHCLNKIKEINTKMANKLLNPALKLYNIRILLANQQTRNLYSKITLGIDGFNLQRQRTQASMASIADKFRDKMQEYSSGDSKNMIFTEDLKNMVHLAEDQDVELVIKMIKRFNMQNNQLRFGNYVFGPVILRLMHVLNKPQEALQLFREDTNGFFDQLMSYQILLDLLYENEMHGDMLEAFELIKARQIEGTKYPKNIVVLVMAGLFKQNSKESLDYALKLWKELNEVGHLPMRRATTFCAGLALNQGQPATAMEIITSTRNQNYTTVRNIKVACLAEIGRIEDAIPLLKNILSQDLPGQDKIHTFNVDVLDKVQKAVEKLNDPDVTLEFQRLYEIFSKQGHISSTTLNEQLCAEIQPPPMINRQRGEQNQYYNNNNRNPRKNREIKSFSYNQRPGLNELL